MYYLLVQLVSIVVLLGMFGINNSAVYFSGKQRISQAELTTHLLFLAVFSSAIFFILIMMCRDFLLGSILKGLPIQYVRIMTFAIPFLMLNQIALSIILGLKRIVLYNVFEMFCYFLLFLNFLIFVVGLRMGISGACLGFVITYFLMDCVYILLFIKDMEWQISRDKIKEILYYGLRSFLGPICLLLIFKADSFVLNLFSDIRNVGFYSIAVSLAELIPFLPLAIGTVLFPKLASQEIDVLNASTIRVVRVIFSFLILLGLTLLFLGRWLILFIYGQMYSLSIVPMYILLPGFVFISLYYLFFSYFNAAAKPEVSTIILIITLIIKVALSIFAIPRWGIIGAAGASTISYSLCGIMFLAAFRLHSKSSLKDIFIIKNSDIKYIWNISASLVNKYRVTEEALP